MFRELIASTVYGSRILEVIEFTALVIEILAVLLIVISIFVAMARYSYKVVLQQDDDYRYRELKVHLGKSLLLGLEILVAADIIRTVALEATFESVVVLGLLVLIRTFLSWALVVEIEGRWPWQPKRKGMDVDDLS
jgi:uncharacterized membrane protein